MVTKKFCRGTFESGILIIINNSDNNNNSSSSSSNRSSNKPQQQQWYNSLVLPPGGFDGPQQTLFVRTRLGFWMSPLQSSKFQLLGWKSILFFSFFFFFVALFFCWSIVLIFTSLWNYSTMQTSTHTYRAFLCAFVCIVSVAVPIQLNHHAKDSTSPQTKWFPDDSLSFSKARVCLRRGLKTPERCVMCVIDTDWDGTKLGKTPRSSCLCQPTI